MKEAMNALIITVLACQLAIQLAPEKESARNGVKLLCGLAVLLTLLSPLRTLIDGAGELRQAVSAYFDSVTAGEEAEAASDPTDPYASAAREILLYAAQTSGSDSAELTLVTADDGAVREIQLFLEPCAYSTRVELREALAEAYGVEVSVFLRESEKDHGKNDE